MFSFTHWRMISSWGHGFATICLGLFFFLKIIKKFMPIIFFAEWSLLDMIWMLAFTQKPNPFYQVLGIHEKWRTCLLDKFSICGQFEEGCSIFLALLEKLVTSLVLVSCNLYNFLFRSNCCKQGLWHFFSLPLSLHYPSLIWLPWVQLFLDLEK